MDRPTKPYSEVAAMLGNAITAWEKLTGHIIWQYEKMWPAWYWLVAWGSYKAYFM